MLRRKIDTKGGLVNGVLGTITAIVTVKFHYIPDTMKLEKVRSQSNCNEEFICVYVYIKQLPLIFAYAVQSTKLSRRSVCYKQSECLFNEVQCFRVMQVDLSARTEKWSSGNSS